MIPRSLLFSALLVSLGLLATCQSKPADAPAVVTQVVAPRVAPTVGRPAAGSVVGTYRQLLDSTVCDCRLALTIWQTGRQLHYRIEDYPEKGFVTEDSAADHRGLGFVSTPQPHEDVHEWSGNLEGDTLLVQTYGNAMNEYENFVGGCSCKFLTLIKQR
jgi:hypothetical protein